MIKKLLLISILSIFTYADALDKEHLNSLKIDALIIKDLAKNELVYTKDIDKRVRPASLTKIMTTILAIEQNHLEKIAFMTPEIVAVEPTKAGYTINEMVILEDLVRSAIIKSNNDAAMAIAVAVAGSVENFVQLMNQKAIELGMESTNFTNPCGFDIGEHYSTPRDLLILAEYAIKNTTFNAITKESKHSYSTLNSDRVFNEISTNKLLGKYEYTVGIKTGYTSKAGPCLIARAKKDDKDMIIVMLNSKENRWELAHKLFESYIEPKTHMANLSSKI